jgi:protein-tyrosine phosphatase
MGGHDRTDHEGFVVPVVVEREFDVVYSLYRAADHGPSGGVDDHYLGIPDGMLTAEQLRDVYRFAAAATLSWHSGRKVLIRCQAGLNRSGLVLAQVLVNNGSPAEEAVELIRTRRSHQAFHNQSFVDYLTTGLLLSAQLSALGTDSDL